MSFIPYITFTSTSLYGIGGEAMVLKGAGSVMGLMQVGVCYTKTHTKDCLFNIFTYHICVFSTIYAILIY
jgi:hypothetical protein